MHDATHYKHPDGSSFPAEECPGLKVLREGKTLVDQEDVFIRKDGKFFDVIYSSSPLKSGDAISGLVVVFRDVTERKQAESMLIMAKLEADEANRTKDQFLAMLSHELRTPLTPVLMTAAALEADRTIATDLREQLGMIRRNIELEARLIDDLLDVTRIAHGKFELREQTVDLHATIDHALTISALDLASKKISITKKLDAKEHHCRGDGARLQEVFWNILRNAVKFTPEGGKIDIVTRNDGDHTVVIEFSDNGIGIEPDLQPRIFDVFEQGARTRGTGNGGLGLGLAISKRIIDLHEGGTIEARSDGHAQGSTFIIKLNTVPAPPPEAHPRGFDSKAPVEALAHILIVEDHKDTSDVLRRILENSGYAVKACSGAGEARDAVKEQKFDLVISDIALPDGSGLDLMRDFQARGLSGIALSGFGTQDDVAASKAAGFAIHLTKPVDLDRLRNAIAELLEREKPIEPQAASA
jgi:signal transduction histidine kinase/CheY-like chemotaxis protein